ncbi:hypothetical protein GCM10023216_14670 [Isoptericola chiayiensis]|uniref:Lipoprotein n=1 Tax=Isoptericola chiayiensis TaxID=579446 RepID=A0ABP8YCH0_9MICO|nr:hypothetical protein [Isoptericola chiayiensis]NOW02097.1 hypothetical protein [Isoptericola chiayiensis]
MMHRLLLMGVVTALAAGATLAACSGGTGDEAASYGSEAIAPADAPGDWQVHETGPVSIALPAGWAEAEPPSSEEGAEAWAFTDGTPAEGENTNGVTVVVSPEAQGDMLTQTENSLLSAERSMGAVDGSSEQLTWPGAADAAYSTYFVTIPLGSEDGEQIRFESLGVVNEAGEQAFVLVYGPDATYDADAVHQVLESVTVQ